MIFAQDKQQYHPGKAHDFFNDSIKTIGENKNGCYHTTEANHQLVQWATEDAIALVNQPMVKRSP